MASSLHPEIIERLQENDGKKTGRAGLIALKEEHRNGPDRDELESPLAPRVVLGAFATTSAAKRSAPAVRVDVDEDFTAALGQPWVSVREPLLLFDGYENGPELHLVRCAE